VLTCSLQKTALALALFAMGCLPETPMPDPATGGSPGAGGSAATGGTSSSGGTTSSGGTALSGGTTGSGGSPGTGGNGTGGSTMATGGKATGGNATGGSAIGGNATGGSIATGGSTMATGGKATGGNATGGSATGGNATGGKATGGAATGGAATGGAATGGAGGGTCTVEDCGTSCTIPAMPAFSALTSNSKLPDPFKMMSGTRITTKSAWPCRRAEIAAALQNYETGKKNPKAPGTVTGSLSGNNLTINVLGKSFTVTIEPPTSGTAPYPAIVYLDSFSLPGNWNGVAKIKLDTNSMGNQTGSRGQGFFFTTTGSNDGAGALIAWAWGVSRIIDALAATPAAKIDATKIAVTGCSRNGKGALMIGAFDERIALTIPQESGSGGMAAWRVSYAEDTSYGGTSSSHKVQTLDSAYYEQPWFSTNLLQFGSTTNVNKLPFDHHELAGMVAPRGLLVLENTDYQWLGVNSVANDATAAQMIFQALGVTDNMGFANSGHTHCVPNSAEGPYVDAFVQKFLFAKTSTATKVWNVARAGFSGGGGLQTVDMAKWVDWTVPTLP
jgi:hypothetical protein